MSEEEIAKLASQLQEPFYQSMSFWISTVLALIGMGLSYLAFIEAKAAKKAASDAGKTVKIQTITIELTEISQRLDKLDFNLTFSEARDLLNEVSRRLHRLISPFQTMEGMPDVWPKLKNALDEAKGALEEVHPKTASIQDIPQNAVYFATQGHFSKVSCLVAEIMGLFEKRTIEVLK